MTARYFFVLIASIGALAIFSSTLSKTPVLPLFAAHLGATPAEIGWIVIASTIPGILISFPAGAISDFFGKRRVIVASLVVFATAPFLYLLVTDAWQLTAVRFYHGFATAIFNTVATAALAAQYPERRAAMLSTYSSITIAGRSVAPFLGGFLISVASFESVYWACAISGVLAFVVGLMLPAESPRSRADVRFPHFFAALRDVLSSRAIMLTSIVEAAQFLVFGAVEAFLALYAASVGIPAWQIGIILGAQLLSVIIVKPLMGNLSDRFGRSAIIFPGLALGAISVALVPMADEVYALSALSMLYGAAFATVTSSTTALVADVAKEGQFGASVGVLRTIMDIGQTIGPVLTGLLIAAWGYGVAFPALATIIAASALMFVFVPRPVASSA
ncbi:MAG: MFS transporter [Betaproteobacteria bacterium]|nr:MFS transporter [Betaproteobacteria bacterium]